MINYSVYLLRCADGVTNSRAWNKPRGRMESGVKNPFKTSVAFLYDASWKYSSSRVNPDDFWSKRRKVCAVDRREKIIERLAMTSGRLTDLQFCGVVSKVAKPPSWLLLQWSHRRSSAGSTPSLRIVIEKHSDLDSLQRRFYTCMHSGGLNKIHNVKASDICHSLPHCFIFQYCSTWRHPKFAGNYTLGAVYKAQELTQLWQPLFLWH